MIGAAVAIAAPPLAAALAGFTYATIAPASQFWGPVIARGPAGTGKVALTFDDGPTPASTERVLDVLRDANVKASFFVIGANAQHQPDLLRRIHDHGHLIANHTFSHWHYGVTRALRYWTDEIRAADEVIESIIGVRPALFRPPMGVKTWHTMRAARELGHTIVTWSLRARDGLPTTAAQITRRFADVGDGSILLLHDGVEPSAPCRDRSATIEALRPLIETLHGKGLRPVRLDELLGVPAYQSRGVTAAAAAGDGAMAT